MAPALFRKFYAGSGRAVCSIISGAVIFGGLTPGVSARSTGAGATRTATWTNTAARPTAAPTSITAAGGLKGQVLSTGTNDTRQTAFNFKPIVPGTTCGAANDWWHTTGSLTTSYTDWASVPAYVSGALVWGSPAP